MAISNTNANSIFNANGVTRDWNLTFQYDSSVSGLDIYVKHADGTSTQVTTNYELDGNILTYPTYDSELDPLPQGDKLIVTRVTPLTQEINLIQQGPLDAETLEGGYDKDILIDQELQAKLDRAIVFPADYDGETDAQEYINDLQELVAAATTQAGVATEQAGIATTNASNAQKWAEGSDEAVLPLGGEHSAKGWANVAKQYAESIGTALKYKGSVSTYSALPTTGQEIGDMWNVLDTGKNYAWTGTEWDDLAGVVDLSAYRTAAAQDLIDATKQDTLVSGTNIKTVNNNSLLGSGNISIDSLPSQTGNTGKFLTTDGSAASWAAIPATVSADGTTIENNSNVLTTIGVKDQNNASNAIKTWTGTKAQYDAIVTKDADTIYNITDDTVLTEFANTSLSNLTNAGKIVGSVLGMPSATFINLTLGASDSTYTATANGYFILAKKANSNNQEIRMENNTNGMKSYIFANNGMDMATWIPCKNGDTIKIYYSAGGALSAFLFIYAEGSKSEA